MSYTLKNIQTQAINGVAPEFKSTNDYYVSKGGNDATGKGSLLSPFLTIQKAINICEALPFGNPRVIHVSSGTYTENLTISKPRISILGDGTTLNPDTGSCIAGSITINLTAGNTDMNNNNIYINGFLIDGLIEDSTALIVHRLFITNCYIYGLSRCLWMHCGGDYRLFVDHCSISNSALIVNYALIECSGIGMVSLSNSKITSKSQVQICVFITGDVSVDTFAQNILTAESTHVSSSPIMMLSTTKTVSIGNCAFIYSKYSVKSNTSNASGIMMANTGNLFVIQCFFSLMGLPAGQMAIYNIGSGKVFYSNNTSSSSSIQYGSSASGISGTLNVNKYELEKVL